MAVAKRWVSAGRRSWLALSAWAAFGLVGCEKEKKPMMFDVFKPEFERGKGVKTTTAITDMATGQAAKPEELVVKPEMSLTGAAPAAAAGATASSPVGTVGPDGRMRGADSDYIDKADTYWKLNWIRIQILNGSIPTEFEEALRKTREVHKTTQRDKNYDIAEAALQLVEEGMAHRKAWLRLQEARVPLSLVPWAGGRSAVEKFIEEGGLGFGAKTQDAPRRRSRNEDEELDNHVPAYRRMGLGVKSSLTSSQQSTLETIRAYTIQYQASPEEMMRNVWRRAIVKINELRDALGLMNRTPNSDGDSTEPGAVITGGTSTTPTPVGSGVDNVVPIPEVGGSSSPKDPTAQPADPFAPKKPDVKF